MSTETETVERPSRMTEKIRLQWLTKQEERMRAERQAETERLRERRSEQVEGLRLRAIRSCTRCRLTIESSGADYVRHVKDCPGG